MKSLSLVYAGFCVFLCPVFYSACDESGQKLPPITMAGHNAFGCMVNGKIFVSKGVPGNVGTYAEVQYGQDTTGINIYATNSDTNQRFVFSLYDSPDLVEHRRYYFLPAQNYSVFYLTQGCDYSRDNLIDGWIEISKYDINGSIMSGTFEFTVGDPNCGDAIKVTEGRFDIGEFIR